MYVVLHWHNAAHRLLEKVVIVPLRRQLAPRVVVFQVRVVVLGVHLLDVGVVVDDLEVCALVLEDGV